MHGARAENVLKLLAALEFLMSKRGVLAHGSSSIAAANEVYAKAL